MDDHRQQTTTVLELHHLHSAVLPLLETLKRTVDLVRDSANDLALLGGLLLSAPDIALLYPRFQNILNCIISAISRPILRDLHHEIGLDRYHLSVAHEALTPREDYWAGIMPVEILQLVKDLRS